jgi:hypothetical protein
MSLTVDLSKLKAALKRFDFASREQVGKTLREQGRGLAMELMAKTAPPTMSRGGAPVDFNYALQKSQNKIQGEIRRVYKPVPVVVARLAEMSGRNGKQKTQNMKQAARVFGQLARGISSVKGRSAKAAGRRFAAAETAAQFLDRLNAKPLSGAQVGQMDNGQEHRRARFGKYRRVPANQFVRLVVTKPPPLDKYVKRKQALIGMTKAGWAAAARGLGGDQPFRKQGGSVKVPAWVKKQKRADGYAEDRSRDPRSPYISVTNNVPWVGSVLTKYALNDTLLYRQIAMVKRLGYVLRQAAKKEGF